MMPTTYASDWSRGYVTRPLRPKIIDLATAVSGITSWKTDNGKLILDTAAETTNTLTINGDFQISVKMWGAGGGGSSGTSGGAGGYSSGIINCTNGMILVCAVGGAGSYVPDSGGATSAGGANGGGRGYRAGAGGGYSGIFLASKSFANSLIIAGGGGGGGHSREGGAGGGTNGQTGVSPTPGYGGSQSSGGGGSEGGSSGGQLYGGSGAGDWGAGGGGGYYGGGGSGETPGQVSGAGGGSGYYNSALVISGSTIGGNYTTVANSSDSDRGSAGNSSTNGRIVIEIL